MPNPRSWTEVFGHLRVLYAQISRRPCPACGAFDVPGHAAWEHLGKIVTIDRNCP
ncbi:MAG: hypothetical protein SXV54_16990 [Chloroflexota bacterium]|nr:hypothetical protein [Chloroflexota bacterium]